MREEFVKAIEKNRDAFDLRLNETQISRLTDYYILVQENNPLLHLVAPCSAEEFAVRHILESLTLLEFLPKNARFADIGTGAGLPSIPCLLTRADLRGVLIESKPKKADFLGKVLSECDLKTRTRIINKQFEETELSPDISFVTCRALDKFTQKLPRLLKWTKNRSLLFFGGDSLQAELEKNKLNFERKLMPQSLRRYLFVIRR